MSDKELDFIEFPDKSTNVIIHLQDNTRIVFASNAVRNTLAKTIMEDDIIELEFDHIQKIVRLGNVTYRASVRELEPDSWLFFNVRNPTISITNLITTKNS